MVLVQSGKFQFELIVTDDQGEIVEMEPTTFRKLFYDTYAWPFPRSREITASACALEIRGSRAAPSSIGDPYATD
jgi:hypothetical protein